MRKTILIVGLALLLDIVVLAGCQRNAPRIPTALPTSESVVRAFTTTPKPTPAATDTATPSPTATSTATPTITPTPTPTPFPSDRLIAAQQAFAWGDYPRAYSEFNALLADPGANAEEAQLAAYWMGRSALEGHEYETALATLQDFTETYPADPRVPSAHLLMAQANEGLRDWQGTISAYEAYLKTADDTLAIYAYEGLGDAAMLALDYDRAAQAYAAGLRVAPDNAWAVNMREGIAQAELAKGNPEKAIEQYDAILSVARIPAYRARILYLAGQAHMMADDTDNAYARFLQTVNRYPEAYDSYLALIELVNADVPVDDYQRGLVDYHAGAYQPAIEAFNRYLETDPQPNKEEDARWNLALSLKANGNLWQAIQGFEEFIATHPESEHVAQAWLEMAETHTWRDSIDDALDTYRDFAEENPQSPMAPNALWEAAELETDTGDLGKAAASFRDLADRYPTDEGAPEALFNAALSEFRRDQFETARQDWAALIENYPDSQASVAARYWLGKAWLALEDPDKAEVAFEEVHEWAPTSYYGLRAAEILNIAPQTTGPADAFYLPNPKGDDQAEAEEWLASWLPITDTLVLSSLDSTISESPAFRRGDALLAVGRRSDALDEFDAIKETWWDDPLAMYQLALGFRERGLYRLSIIAAERLSWLSPASSRAEVPDFIQRISYPLNYQELILSEAQSQDIDALLLLALIRQESLFEPSITSPANARGLTQVIPDTGEWIAGRLGWGDFNENDLYLPYVSIHFGSFYLAVQIATFDEEPIPALAAYNAGPGRVHRWLEDAPDVDLFVETMPFVEPRRYVRNVIENYANYQRLYLSEP